MICPECDRAVAHDAARCPACGASTRPAQPGGSAVLRPDADLPGGRAETPLIDQEHALRRLRAAWRNAHVGYGQVVSLVGENGSGRSRLIRELGRAIDAEAPQARWLVGEASSGATYRPFNLLADLLAPWGGDAAAGAGRARLAAALDRFADGAPATERWSLLAFAGELRDPESPDGPPPGPLAEALARAIRRATEGKPVVVVLEDLEWADAPSLAVFDTLLPRLTQGAALVLCTHHGDWSHDWPDLPRHGQLFLGPLAAPESRRLIAALDAGRALDAATAEALALAAGGNPLLLEQATLAALEGGAAPATPPVAATLGEAVGARLAALSPGAREVLLAAAAIGPRFAYRAIAMVTEAALPDRRAIDAALRELAARRLVLRWRGGPEVGFRFGHHLIQEVAYAALGPERRAALEARVADWHLSESALRGRLIGDFDRRAADAAPAPGTDRLLTSAAPVRAAPTPLDLHRRGNVLARIVLADLDADQRASLAFCLQHGYSYAEAGELLGIGEAEVRAYLLQARQRFKRLYEASAPAPVVQAEGRAGEPR